ncbi:hypothetical protein DL764_001772 [Monosporascus ibericus]|uniref:Uncharacterized protein n=1 Tax=Monosporascus ibericus TaxID=155417 RepID=A0A4Q4TQM1_9PEZI|nr:hypothetical protein DL764_001772 [Monosporascus ibericus]
MASITNKIHDAAHRNQELLAILQKTDHAKPALEHQKQYIADLTRDLSEAEKRVDALDEQREKELKDHEKYRDSVMKRFAYKVTRKTDKFEAKASKEEQEYLQVSYDVEGVCVSMQLADVSQVLQESHRAKEQKEQIATMREEALAVQSGLEKEVARHNQAQQDLDRLYNSIFEGPTPSFPEEDATERDVQSAEQACNHARKRLECEQQAANLLNQATARLNSALSHIEDALGHSRMDMFGGGSFSDFMERDALHNAESQVRQMEMLVMQAQRYSDSVQSLPPIHVSQGNLIGDVLFDNIFSDMEFHEKIKASREEIRRCGSVLRSEVQAAHARVQECQAEMDRLSEVLSGARAALQKARERIFDRITSDSEGVPAPVPGKDAPPPYQA